MNNNKYIILGGGGSAGFCIEQISNGLNSKYITEDDKFRYYTIMQNIEAIYIDPELPKETNLDYPIIDNLKDYSEYIFIPAVLYPSIKEKHCKLAEQNGLIPCKPIIHPHVQIPKSVTIGDGTIISEFTVIQQNVKIGKYFFSSPLTSISHDSIIGKYCTRKG